MPKSEAPLDARADNLRVRLPGFNDSVGRVRFANGEAIDPMSPQVLVRLRGIGFALEVVGSWSDTPAAPVVADEPIEPPAPPAEPVVASTEFFGLDEFVAPSAPSPVVASQGARPAPSRQRAPGRPPR